MKKVFTTMMGASMVLSLLAGCSSGGSTSGGASTEPAKEQAAATADSGSGKSDGKKIELTYWTLFAGGDGEYMDQIISNFNKSQDEILIKNVKLEWAEYYTKLVTGVSGGKGPDIGISHTSKLPELIKAGVVTPLDDTAKAAGLKWEDYNSNILSSATVDGKHYAVPIDTHPFIMYYNKKHLQTAGLLDGNGKPILEPGADGFVKFLTTLKEKLPKDVTPFAFSNNADDPYRLWWALYSQQGGNDVISDDGKSPAIDMDKAMKAANYIKDLYYTSKVIKPQDPDFYKTFQSGKGAIMMTGVWATGTWETTKDLDFGAMAIPNIFGNTKTWGDSHTIILPVTAKEDPKKREAALKFAMYATEQGGQIWAKAGHIPADSKVFESDGYKALKYRSDYKAVASDVVFPKVSDKTWPKNDILKKYLDEIWLNKTATDVVFKKIDSELKTLLAK
ncbi:type 2 periplasmic-binding domain-containing protein [Paenibacillus hexagrammi]|uniref:ABC transporter substrate-binding protein n=1 Tax=Paenibacillus hexagrammi TaxID=2908839 RepID=A0ABY3SQL7_9BACL|nr:ABC transporter substrate-binding protein [Paenibacillus sp. YPD9-1]UJF36284.1 ABC transporter substrate-binding protein [Paenibacillus sp. YPD9-1]